MTLRNVGRVASVALVALLGFPSTQARAAGDREPGPPRRPPQEAIDACTNQSEGVACTVSFHGQAVQGNYAQEILRAQKTLPTSQGLSGPGPQGPHGAIIDTSLT